MRTTHFLLALCASISMSAATPSTVINNDDDISVIPSSLLLPGESVAVFTGYADKTTSIKIYDAKMSLKTEISLPQPPALEYEQWRQYRKSVPTKVELEMTYEYDRAYYIPDGTAIDEALTIVKEYGYREAEKQTIDGSEVIATRYYMSEYFGKKYVENFIKQDSDGDWIEYRRMYNATDYQPTWVEKSTYSDKFYPDEFDYVYLYADCVDSDGVPVTQNFFNSDNKFEYVVPKYELIEYSYEYEDERGGGQRACNTGYEVKSQDGSTLQTFDIPDEYVASYTEYASAGIMILEGNKYFIIKTREVRLVYEVGSLGSLKAPVVVAEGMRVNPGVARHGENVTVDLGVEAKEGCIMTLTSVNGRTILTRQLQEGEKSSTINTANLAAGTYVVSVKNGNTSNHEAAKIIVR